MQEKTRITLYILLCADDSYYTGVTRKLSRRLAQHRRAEVVYTATRLPVRLVFVEKFRYEAEAVAREQQIKGWTRRKKEALVHDRPEQLPGLAKKKWRKHHESSSGGESREARKDH